MINDLIHAGSFDEALNLLTNEYDNIHPLLFQQKHIEIARKMKSRREINKIFVDMLLSK